MEWFGGNLFKTLGKLHTPRSLIGPDRQGINGWQGDFLARVQVLTGVLSNSVPPPLRHFKFVNIIRSHKKYESSLDHGILDSFAWCGQMFLSSLHEQIFPAQLKTKRVCTVQSMKQLSPCHSSMENLQPRLWFDTWSCPYASLTAFHQMSYLFMQFLIFFLDFLGKFIVQRNPKHYFLFALLLLFIFLQQALKSEFFFPRGPRPFLLMH